MAYRLKTEKISSFRIFDYLKSMIRNRIHVTVCSAAAAWTWSQLTGSQILTIDLVVVPLTMACIYQLNRIFDLNEDSINSPAAADSTQLYRNWIIYFCLSAGLFVLILSFASGSITGVLILSTVICLGIFYSMPLFSITGRRLKNFTLIKNLTSAAGWTLLVVFYPPIHAGYELIAGHWVASMVMFTTVWMVELIWDIRDQKGDALSGVNTIPVLQGVDSARQWIMIINTCAVLLLLVVFASGYISAIWLLILFNNFLIYAWIPQEGTVIYNRKWSHLLVGMQTMILVALGIYAVFLT
jgi:4-hydroxybenzoate polyprenyltransferase